MNLQIGDIVVIKNNGLTYTTYDKMFRKLGFADKKYNECFDEGTVGRIFNIGDHSKDGCILAIESLQNSKEQCLIHKDGVEFVYRDSVSEYPSQFLN